MININNYLLPSWKKYIPSLSSKKEDELRSLHPNILSLLITKSGKQRTLLSSSFKFDKEFKDWTSTGLYLDPSLTGFCPFKGACARTCLTFTGRLPLHHNKRLALSYAFMLYPLEFLQLLLNELAVLEFSNRLKGLKTAFRFNGTSDIRIEKILDITKLSNDLAVQWYDYTKAPLALRDPSPSYHLTFSIDEKNNSIERGLEYIEAGYSTAIVLSGKEKANIEFALSSFDQVVDGDKHDLRFLDKGNISILRAKNLIGSSYDDVSIIRTLDDLIYLLN